MNTDKYFLDKKDNFDPSSKTFFDIPLYQEKDLAIILKNNYKICHDEQKYSHYKENKLVDENLVVLKVFNEIKKKVNNYEYDSTLMDHNMNKNLWDVEKLKISISPSLIILLFISILAIFVFVFKTSPDSIVQKQFDTLSKGFSIISVLMLVYVIYINVDYNATFQENTIRNNSYKISKELYIDIIEKMIDKLPESYFILNQVETFDDRSEEELVKIIPHDPNKRLAIDDFFSSIIIENFENFLSLKKYLVIEQFSWILTFYFQFQAPIIIAYWSRWKDTYSPIVNIVIEQFIQIFNFQKKYDLTDEQIHPLLLNIVYRKEK